MSSFYDLASLVMIPSGKKAGKVYSQKPLTTDGQLDFTRASTATRIGSDGLIEKTRTNLLLQSNSFNTTWTTSNVTLTSGQSGYNGTSNAWKLLSNSSSSESYVRQTTTLTGVGSVSVYAKAGNVNFLGIYIGSTGVDVYSFFNLSTGLVGTKSNTIDAKIESVGSGWYRCSVTGNNLDQNINLYVTDADGNFLSSNDNFIYIQDSQLEPGLVATNVITTTTAAVSVGSVDNMPRLNYTPGSATSCPSLLLEPQRTNLLAQSEYFESSSYSKNNTSVTSNNAISPDGTLNASKFVENTSNSSHSIYKNVVNGSGDFTISIFVKSAERSRVLISNATTTRKATFNLSNATISDETGVSASMVSFGNDWYRCIISYNTTSVADEYFSINIIDNLNNLVYQGDGSSGVYIYGAQLEVGSYATSYIPTFGATVTRVLDVGNNLGSGSIFNDSEGVLYVDVDFLTLSGNDYFGLNNGTNNERILIQRSTNNISIFINNSGNLNTSLTSTINKIAVSYKANDYKLYLNGNKVDTDTSSSVTPSGLNIFGFQLGGGFGLYFYGNAKQVLYFPTVLTDTQLAELTSIDS